MKSKDFFFAGKYYLIYNHGNADEHIFKNDQNYYYFLKRLYEHMNNNWELISWCLLPDRYYLVVKIKNDFQEEVSWQGINRIIYSSFGNFTNGYAKAINKAYSRRGSLFAKKFSRKLIITDFELKKTILFMHEQPLIRNLAFSPFLYNFSSCHKAKLYTKSNQFKEMIRPFGTLENFLVEHNFIPQQKSAA